MPDFEIRIRLTDTTEAYAQHVAWSVGKALDGYPHLDVTLEPPLLVNPPGSTVEQLPGEVLARIEPGDYLSTACETAKRLDATVDHDMPYAEVVSIVGWVDHLHGRCRRNHKFMGAPCRCLCHGEAGGG